jgi:adenylate cyclase
VPSDSILAPEEILGQVDRICQSKAFAQSARLADFLRFTVNETLAGKAASLKESLIGVEVYRRPPDYDPKVDSIVRSEAVRLRSKLQTYYEAEGRHDQVRIQYPRGSYVPRIEPRGQAVWAPSTPTIAVLPFANAGLSAEDEFFSDGLTDELIAVLAKIPNLRVVARTSAFQFKGKALDVRRAGRQLNATAILEGSVRRWQDRIRITAQLIDVESGSHWWSDSYEREWRDVFAIQDEISRAVARSLAQEFAAPRTKPSTTDPEAHRLLLKGRYCFYKWTVEQVHKSLAWFAQATARDPNFAKAWAAIGDAHGILAFWGVSPERNAALSGRALRRALELDPDLPEAQATYAAHLAVCEWQWGEAERRFRPRIGQGDSMAEHLLAVACLIPQGRLEEAAECLRRALELDPLFLGAQSDLGRVLYLAGDHQKAIEQQLRVLELDGGFREAHWQLALAYESAGAFDEAMASFGRALALSGDSPGAWGSLGHCYARWGRIAEARRYEQMLRQAAPEPLVVLPARALIYAGLEDTGAALQCLEDSFVRGSPACLRLRTDPRFAALRRHPRYQSLLQRMGLPPG